MADPIVEAHEVTKAFGTRVALDHVSLAVDAGAIVALLGPNGGGKTTLFRILSTLLTPDSGSVRIGGCDVLRESSRVRRLIGVVFQSPSLDGKLTVAENLRHYGYFFGLKGRELAARIAQLVERFELADRMADRVETLSGGLARRVEIAKSMLPSPRVLLLDEPSTGLDPAARRNLWRQLEIARESDGVSVLLTTHIMVEAESSDRVVLLDRGHVVADGTPEALTSRVGGDVVSIVTDEPESVAQRAQELIGSTARIVDGTVHLETPEGASSVPRLAAALHEEMRSITLSKPTLEDAFLHITGRRFDMEASE